MIEWVTTMISSLGYLGIFFLMFLETVFPPIPSEVVIPFAGFTASTGSMNLWLVITAATLGSMFGACSLYALGKLLREEHVEEFIRKYGRYIGLRVKDVQAAQGWFDRHGYLAVLLCRMLPGARSLISLPAGFRKLRPVAFFLYSLLGTSAWTIMLAVGGYLLGEQYHHIEGLTKPLTIVVVLIILVGVSVLLFKRIKAGKADSES